jgi:hypothetical protein
MSEKKPLLNLEQQSQKVASVPRFLNRLLRYALFAGGLMLVSVGGGTLGYHYFAQLTYVDSFHMACMILTGMGPVAEMKNTAAKLFSSVYALYSGIAFLSMTAFFFAPILHRILHILHVDRDEEVNK